MQMVSLCHEAHARDLRTQKTVRVAGGGLPWDGARKKHGMGYPCPPLVMSLKLLSAGCATLKRVGHTHIRNGPGIVDMPIASQGALPPDALPTGADGSPAATVAASLSNRFFFSNRFQFRCRGETS